MIQMIYPDEQRVTEAQVRGWLSDAIANGEVDDPLWTVESTPLEYVLQVLQDTGKFTFARLDFHAG